MTRWGGVVTGWSLVVCLAMAAQAASGPSQVVSTLNGALLDVLKRAETLGYQGRYDRLRPVMTDVFDLDFMAEKSLGRHWKDLGEDDRKRWVALFRDFTVATYAANFDKYSGQSFELLGEEPGGNETILVKTRVVNPGGDNVELSYRLQQSAPSWRIVDVYLKGTVSELALRRSDYSSLIEREGFEALVTSLRNKITDLVAGRGKRESV